MTTLHATEPHFIRHHHDEDLELDYNNEDLNYHDYSDSMIQNDQVYNPKHAQTAWDDYVYF